MALIQMRLLWRLGGLVDPKGAHLDFEVDPTPPTSVLVDMATAAVNDWARVDGLSSHFATDVVLDRVETFQWDPVTDSARPPCVGETTNPFKRKQVTVPQVVSSGAGGTVVGSSAPPNVAFVVKFKTALAGPRHRGRIFLPPLPEGAIDPEGFIAQTEADAIALDVQQLVEAVEIASPPTDIDHIVWSSCLNTTEEITTYEADRRIDTQRRRLPQLT